MEEHGLVVVKESVFSRLAESLRRIFYRGKVKNLLLEGESSGIRFIRNDVSFAQQEILNARRAYRKYVINNMRNLAKDVFSYVGNRIKENEDRIRQIIEINKDDISYEEILKLLSNEKRITNRYKVRNRKTGCYNVPIGVIGVECTNVSDSIRYIFKSISTRNAIIILHENYSDYSTESLILLIVKECLKNFYIDDNIIQMFDKSKIDIQDLDKFIAKDGNGVSKDVSKSIYIYQENDCYSKEVDEELAKLRSMDMYQSYEIELVKGEFGNVVNYLNSRNAHAVCMYTNNAQKAYKFINWVNSPNVFVNTGIRKCSGVVRGSDEFYNSKYVLHEDVF